MKLRNLIHLPRRLKSWRRFARAIEGAQDEIFSEIAYREARQCTACLGLAVIETGDRGELCTACNVTGEKSYADRVAECKSDIAGAVDEYLNGVTAFEETVTRLAKLLRAHGPGWPPGKPAP